MLRYMIKTDTGLVSCVLGAAADKELKDRLTPGVLLSIHY
ncbi:unnamed protein product, partial [marine sediment metagenome]